MDKISKVVFEEVILNDLNMFNGFKDSYVNVKYRAFSKNQICGKLEKI